MVLEWLFFGFGNNFSEKPLKVSIVAVVNPLKMGIRVILYVYFVCHPLLLNCLKYATPVLRPTHINF